MRKANRMFYKKEIIMKKTINILCYYTLLCVFLSSNVVAQTFSYLPEETNGHQMLTYRQFTTFLQRRT